MIPPGLQTAKRANRTALQHQASKAFPSLRMRASTSHLDLVDLLYQQLHDPLTTRIFSSRPVSCSFTRCASALHVPSVNTRPQTHLESINNKLALCEQFEFAHNGDLAQQRNKRPTLPRNTLDPRDSIDAHHDVRRGLVVPVGGADKCRQPVPASFLHDHVQ